jgi:hypothetical protein
VNRKPRPSVQESTAHHEAGHAIAALHLRRPFHHASIVPDEERGTLGHACCPNRIKPNAWRSELSTRRRSILEQDIMVRLAGGIVEERFTGRNNPDGCVDDESDAFASALVITDGDDEEARALIAWLRIRTANALFRNPILWSVIQAVAAELLVRQTMTAAEVRAVWHNTLTRIRTSARRSQGQTK